MAKRTRARQPVPDETDELKNRLQETEETLEAIRQYLVDAFVVTRSDGTHVVTIKDADYPYRLMVEAMNEGAVTLIPDGTILYSNPRFCEMLALKCGQLVGVRFQELVLPDNREAFELILQESVEAGRSGMRAEFCLQPARGECVPVQLSVYQLPGEGTRGISIIATDLTERRQAEDALRKNENLFRFIATSSPDVIFAQDHDLRYTWIINPAAPLTAEDVVGKTDWELLPPDEAQETTKLKKRVLTTGESLREDLFLSIGETQRWYDAVYQPIFDGKGQTTGIIGYARNITESILAKEKIRSLASALTKAEQVERHRISQILHDDLQQRLFAIKAQLSMLTYGGENGMSPKMQSALQQIQSELADTVAITRNLSVEMSPVVLHGEGLAHAILWLASQMREQFGLQVEFTSKDDTIYLEDHMRVLLFRAVRELLFNIVKHAHVTRATVSLAQVEDKLRITVSDAGTGFDVAAVMSDINVSHGLLVIRDRLNLMGGRMEVTSKLGEGTRVVIETPLEAKTT